MTLNTQPATSSQDGWLARIDSSNREVRADNSKEKDETAVTGTADPPSPLSKHRPISAEILRCHKCTVQVGWNTLRFHLKQAHKQPGGYVEYIWDKLNKEEFDPAELLQPIPDYLCICQPGPGSNGSNDIPSKHRQTTHNRLVEQLFLKLLPHSPVLQCKHDPSVVDDIDELESRIGFRLLADMYILDSSLLYWIMLTDSGWYLVNLNMDKAMFLASEEGEEDICGIYHQIDGFVVGGGWVQVWSPVGGGLGQQHEAAGAAGLRWW